MLPHVLMLLDFAAGGGAAPPPAGPAIPVDIATSGTKLATITGDASRLVSVATSEG